MSGRTFIYILLIFCQLQLQLPLAMAQPPSVPPVPPQEAKKANELKTTKLGDYFIKGFDGDQLPHALQEDVLLLMRKGAELGLLPGEFEKWWNEKKFTPRLLKEYKDLTIGDFVGAMYTKYLMEKAEALDKLDPKSTEKKEKGEPTDGDYWLVRQLKGMTDNKYGTMIIGGVAGFVIGLVVNLGNMIYHGFVAGPVAASVNTALEPITKPLQDRIRQEVNKRLAQRKWIRKWTILLTGEEGKRKAAAQAASEGKEIKGDAAHYDMPGVEVEDFAKDTRAFFEEMLAADLRWRGWTLDEVARARQTGFMILFEQPRLIGEQIMGAQSRIDIVKIRQRLEYAPKLLSPNQKNRGATKEEVKRFDALLKQIDELKKGNDKDPGLLPLEQELAELSAKWTARGVKPEHIGAYRAANDHEQRLEATLNLMDPGEAHDGATEEEIKEFSALMKKIHFLKKFKSPLDPAISPLEDELIKLTEKWLARGVKLEDIHNFRESEKHYLVAMDRTAFVMASVLYAELYFQEYNRALNGLHQLQQWQELSREMIGFYEALEEHKEAIQMYFEKKGLKYDVQARIDERGHPLGGPRRPKELAPLRDRLDHYFKTGKLADLFTPPGQGEAGNADVDNGGRAKSADQAPQYTSRKEFDEEMEKIARELNALIERSLAIGDDPMLDIAIEAKLDAAYSRLLAAPPDWRDKARALWLDLKSFRFPRISRRIEEMRKQGPLHSQVAAGVKLELNIGRNLFAVNCVLRYRDLKPLRTVDQAMPRPQPPPAPVAPAQAPADAPPAP